MRIAILGWGSLLWEGGEFDDWHDAWQYDGPSLKIEFSRISERRLGALTLVIDAEHGSPTTVAWCLSKRETIEDAICDLGRRERTTLEGIGHIHLNQQATLPNATEAEERTVAWARDRKLDAVIWTGLHGNFSTKAKIPFSVGAAVAYVKQLSPTAMARAAEYVWRAPDFVRTPVRSALQRSPWFPKPSR